MDCMQQKVSNLNVLSKGFTAIHLNCQSICNKFDLVKYHVLRDKPDLFCMSETWLRPELPDNMFIINNYILERADRNWIPPCQTKPKRGGGTGVFIKSDLNYSAHEYQHLNHNNNNIEILWISIHQPNQRKLVIDTLYRPPEGSVLGFCEILKDMVNQITLNSNAEVFLLGDYNIDYFKVNHPHRRELKSLESLLGMSQLITDITRHSNVGTCIDLLLSNSGNVSKSGVLNWNISDHEPTFFVRKKVRITYRRVNTLGRSYLRYDRDRFIKDLKASDWSEFDVETDPNKMWDLMKSNILNSIDKQCPLKQIRVKDRNDPWITQGIIELINDKDEARKKAKRSNKDEDWARARTLKHLVKNTLKNAKRDFILNNLNDKKDAKKFWKTINSVLPNAESKQLINLVDDNNDIIPLEKSAESINKFFTNVGNNLATQFDEDWVPNFPPVDFTMADFNTNVMSVKNLCRDIDETKASAIDNLSSRILKHAFLALTVRLTRCFNMSLTSGIFPDEWKVAKVVPLHKGGDRTRITNYRPISLLPLPGKILEKIMHEKLLNYVERYNLLNPNQGGFRLGYSTVETIGELTDDIAYNNNILNNTLVVYIDFKKAFDTVDHSIILNKLSRLGIKGNALKWLESYLSNRKQCTIANNITSDNLPITCGVPQGSILGPFLFLIHINDINRDLVSSKIKLYADDTVLYLGHNKPDTLGVQMQSELDLLSRWCFLNRLTINTTKTKCMYFPAKKNSVFIPPRVSLKNVPLEYVTHYKYLGVHLDSKLNFQTHLNQVYKLASHKIYLLSKIRNLLTEHAALTIYRSKILPYFDWYQDKIPLDKTP